MAPAAPARQAERMTTGDPVPGPMHVGIVGGTGPAGSGLAVRLAAAGHHVEVGSREIDRAKQRVAELQEQWGDRAATIDGVVNEDAARADVVVLAAVAGSVVETAAQHAAALAGRVVVSMANLVSRTPRGFATVVPPEGSVAMAVQRAAPAALVVGAFQNLPAKALGDLDQPLEADVVVCGDDAGAVKAVIELTNSIGGLHGVDGGPLVNAIAVEALTAVLLSVNKARRGDHGVRIVELRRHP
jgi:NADPH-dependent F420 reductase